MTGLNVRLADQLVIGLGFILLVVIGVVCSRRSKTDEGYFLAGRSMPGWVVGFSLMATICSSMTFLALPAFAFGNANWRNFIAHFAYIPAIALAVYLFIPLYRSMRVRSAYEYLERRFGLWARMYAAGAFVLFHSFRTGLVLYAVSLSIGSILQVNNDFLPMIIVAAGVVVSVYTIVGGLRAVIWTDVLQGIALISGGLICLPVIVSQLPGGFSELFSVASADGKFDLGSTEFTLKGKTVWAYTFAEFMLFMQLLVTDQTNVQRYAAAASDKAASRGAIIGCWLAVPTWSYFVFLGTCLYVFVKVVPGTGLEGLEPDEVFPRFILTQVPAGFAGFVLTGLLASAMSTLDSSINATAATFTTDFYRRLWVTNQDPGHYGNVGKLASAVFSIVMITTACGVHFYRVSETLDDLQRMLLSILGGGLLSLFLLGFVTLRVDSRAAIVATSTTVMSVAGWLLMDTPFAKQWFPGVAEAMPDNFWVSTFANLLLFTVAYTVSLLIGSRRQKQLGGLTIWK
jgi:SSS family solute:Na+ symporter